MSRPSPELVGVVLAGGASRRMGRDKARLRLSGVGLAEAAARKLGRVAVEVLVADGGRRIVPGLASIADGPGAGPAAGLLGAAAHRPGRDLLVLACDLPQVPVELLARLAGDGAGDALVPRWQGGCEVLCARYRPAALAVLAEQVGRGQLALQRLLTGAALEITYLESQDLADFGPPAEIFCNLNRPQDLARLEKRRQRGSRLAG